MEKGGRGRRMSDMSRSEVIEYRKEKRHELIEFWEDYKHENHEVQALDIAITSLETDEAYQLMEEQPEFCEDCISRKAAIEVFKNEEDAEATSWYLAGVVFRLEDLPSVLPKLQFYPPCQDCNTKMDEIRKAYDKVSFGTMCKDVLDYLEQEPTTKNNLGVDCVSRADVNRLICEYRDDATETGSKRDLERAYGANAVGKLINELPSAMPKPRWIPVEEKLPEDGQNVLFCDIDNDIMVGYHIKGRSNTHFQQDGTYEDMKNVRAWMPLPEPFEPQESEDKE